MVEHPGSADFDDVYARADQIPGWLTRDQAQVLFDEARATGSGATIVEIGSHLGRSTVVLAVAAGARCRVVAIDPFLQAWRYGRPDTESSLRSNLAAAGVSATVEVQATTSSKARAGWSRPVGLLYIDGKHDYWTVRDDLQWAEHVVPGGTVLLHDSFSSIGVTLALLRTTMTTPCLRYVDRTGSLARFVVAEVSMTDRLRPLAPLPWWLRNIGVKMLLRVRMRPVARLLRHDDTADPY
jgi:predicted O-methyltransferase YrrM